MELNKEIRLSGCINGYENASVNITRRLYNILLKIQDFYSGSYWIKRFKRRLLEENIRFNNIEQIQNITSELIDKVLFKLFDKDSVYNGVSNRQNMIALNINFYDWKQNDSHIQNVVMHEFGHLQYLQKEFQIIVDLNRAILNNLKPFGLKSEVDERYFSNHNEIRQRIVPIIKEMLDNHWNFEQTYNLSENLRNDAIFTMYNKKTILFWLKNLL